MKSWEGMEKEIMGVTRKLKELEGLNSWGRLIGRWGWTLEFRDGRGEEVRALNFGKGKG